MKFWQDHSNNKPGLETTKYTSTYYFDKRLYKHDIMGSIAHCTMLGEQGIISTEEATILRTALTQIFYDVTSSKLVTENKTSVFDVLDNALTEKVGEISEKINIARTSADRFALDMRMYTIEAYNDIAKLLKSLATTFIDIADKNYSTVIPSYYCGVKGQPTTLAHILMSFAEALVRDIERIDDAKKRVNIMPLYSAYGTGTKFNVNRKRVAGLLNFSAVTQNSLDAITDVDYMDEFLSISSSTLFHITKISNTYIDWNKLGLLLANEKICKSSDINPSANVPAIFETIVARSNKSIPLLSSNKYVSAYYSYAVYEQAESLFDVEAAVKFGLDTLITTIPLYEYVDQMMTKVATADFSVAHDCVDYLIDKGSNVNDAYEIVGKLCQYCLDAGKRLDTLEYEIYAGASTLFDADIISLMRIKNATRLRKHDGEPGEVAVRAEIRTLQRKIKRLVTE